VFLPLLMGAALAAGAQEFRGTLTGHVTDPDGAFIPASVTAVNDATQQTWTRWFSDNRFLRQLKIA
jgi:hypothetical protein